MLMHYLTLDHNYFASVVSLPTSLLSTPTSNPESFTFSASINLVSLIYSSLSLCVYVCLSEAKQFCLLAV